MKLDFFKYLEGTLYNKSKNVTIKILLQEGIGCFIVLKYLFRFVISCGENNNYIMEKPGNKQLNCVIKMPPLRVKWKVCTSEWDNLRRIQHNLYAVFCLDIHNLNEKTSDKSEMRNMLKRKKKVTVHQKCQCHKGQRLQKYFRLYNTEPTMTANGND